MNQSHTLTKEQARALCAEIGSFETLKWCLQRQDPSSIAFADALQIVINIADFEEGEEEWHQSTK